MSFKKYIKSLKSQERKEKKELHERVDKINYLHTTLNGYLTKAQKKVIINLRKELDTINIRMEAVYREKLKEQEFLTLDKEILFLEQLAKDPKTFGQKEIKDEK